MITSLDDQVGRIVAALEKRGLRENTLIIFSSDNGGPRSAVVASGAHSKEERDGERRQAGVTAGEQRRPARRQGQPVRGRRPDSDHLQLAGQAQARASSTSRCTSSTSCRPRSRWPGATANPPTSRSTARTSGRRVAEGKPSPHDGHPGERRGVPRRRHQGQVEAGEGRAAAGKDRAVRPVDRSRREDQRRRRRTRTSSAISRLA